MTPEVLVAPLVVVAPLVEVAPEVVVWWTFVEVVGLTLVVVVVPPEVLADASCPTLTPATTSNPTRMSHAAVRREPSSHAWPSILPSFRNDLTDRNPHTMTNKTTAGALGGQKATLRWDGLPAHRGLAMAAWLRRQRS